MYEPMEYVSLLDIVTTTESSLRSPVSLEESIDRDTIFYTTSILYEKDHDSSIEDYLSFEEMDHSYLYYSNDTLYNYLEELNQEHSYKGFWSSSLYTYEHDQPFSLYKTRLEYLGDDSYSAELLEEKANELSAHTVDDLSYIIPNEPEYIRLNELVHREGDMHTKVRSKDIL
jgi:hypothetical protein